MALTLGKSVSSANHIQRALSSTSQCSPSSTHKTLMCAVVQRRLPLLSLSLALPSSLTHTARLARSYNNSTERERERDSEREKDAKQPIAATRARHSDFVKAQRVRAGSFAYGPSVQSVVRAVHVHHGRITENFACMTTYPVSRCRVMRATSMRSQTCSVVASSRTKEGRERERERE